VAARSRLRRRLTRALGLGLVLGIGTLAGCVAWTRLAAHRHIYSAASVPPAPVALVLGAAVHPDGTPSPFLRARLELAKQLYDAGTVRVLLVSGDGRDPSYDEPGVMRDWLIAHGVPARRVVADTGGLDTYDSCVRAKRIFGVDHLIVVTQSYHLPRAVTVCRAVGVTTDGVGDESVWVHRRAWRRAALREQFATVKAAVDVATRRDPAVLGPGQTAVDDALRD
jgi:vancomycin permeability regulator SanA